MTVVGTAEILAHAVTAPFERELEAGAQRAFKVVEAEAKAAGVVTGESMASGVAASEAKSSKAFAGTAAAGKKAFFGVGLAAAGALAESTHLAEGMQKTDAAIAGATHTSVEHATQIGDAMLKTAGVNTYAGTELAKAYSTVAGQLQNLNGKALDAAQSVEFMKAASSVAEAKQMDLGAATKAVANTMQAFGIGVEHAAHVADVLVNSSNATGQSVDALGTTLGRLHSKLGDSAGSLSQLGGLLLDMTEHGITGRVALSSLSVGMTTIQKSANEVSSAQGKTNDAFDKMSPSLQKLAKAYQSGKISSSEFGKATASLPPAQAALVTAFNSGTKATAEAKQKYEDLGVTVFNSKGKFVGMGSVIEQLEPKFKKMTQQQQISTAAQIFGQGAAKQMTAIINAGSGAYEKATRAVAHHGSAESAAEKQAKTLHGQVHTLEATMEDLGTQIGEKIIPTLTHMATTFLHGTQYILNHKASMIALTAVITGVLGVAIAVFTINKMAAFGKSFMTAGRSLGIFAAESTAAAGVVEADMVGIEAAAVETSAGVDVAIGSTGIGAILIGVGIAATLLLTHWHEVMHAISSAAGEAKDFIEDHWKLIAEILLGPLGGIIAGYDHFHTEIEGFFSSAAHKISGVWSDVVDTASSVPGKITHFFASLPGKIVGEFSSLPSQMLSIGEHIVSGIINGIENKLGDLEHEASKIAHKVTGAVGSFLGISSPSKVMHQYGVWTTQGFQQGIASQAAMTMNTPLGKISYSMGTTSGVVATAASTKSGGLDPSKYDHAYKADGGATLTPLQIRAIAESVGFSPKMALQMSQITRGESSYQPGIIQKDPGDGMVGYGLTQVTPGNKTPNWGAAAMAYFNKLGGREAMLNPVTNMKMAKYLSDHSGGAPLSPWYGTQYLDRNPGTVHSVLGKTATQHTTSAGGGAKAQKDLSVKIVEETAAFKKKIAEELASVKDGTKAQKAAMATQVTNQRAAFAILVANQRAEAKTQTAAQRKELAKQTSDQKAGTTTMNSLLKAIHTGSLASLKSAVENAHLKGVDKMVKALSNDHSKALAALSKKLEQTWKDAQVALKKQQSVQDAKDLQTWVDAVDQADAAAIDAASKMATDQAAVTLADIADSTKVTLDRQAEAGKTGLDLTAAQAQTALDNLAWQNNATITRDQVAVDAAASGTKVQQAQAAAQLAADQSNAAIMQAQAQANLDLANAAASAADAAAQAIAPDSPVDSTPVDSSTPDTTSADTPAPYFHFTLVGSGMTAGDLMSEVSWALKTGAIPMTPELTPALPAAA